MRHLHLTPTVDRQDSKDLVARADQGNREALDLLFERERPRLARLIALRAGAAVLGKNEIDDLVQEAYVEALRQLPQYTYQGRDSFFRWLASIALHRIANLRRSALAGKRDQRKEVRFVGPESADHRGGVSDAPAKGPGPRTLSVGAEETSRLDAALAELAAPDREVILLARVEGLSLKEIAERMERTSNAVALLLSRALRKLKRILDASGA